MDLWNKQKIIHYFVNQGFLLNTILPLGSVSDLRTTDFAKVKIYIIHRGSGLLAHEMRTLIAPDNIFGIIVMEKLLY